MQPEPPLDYAATLDLLASWVGRNVLVIAHSQAPGEPMSHTQVTALGELGAAEMVDNAIDELVQSVAGFAIGNNPATAIYLSVGDFLHAIRSLGQDHLNIKFEHDFHIEIQLQ